MIDESFGIWPHDEDEDLSWPIDADSDEDVRCDRQDYEEARQHGF